VVAYREDPKNFGGSGVKVWLRRVAVIGLTQAILAIPSVVAGLFVLGPLHRGVGEVLHDVFPSLSTWVSLAVVFWSHAGQTIGELRSKPDLTIKETGVARGNLFGPPHPRDGPAGLLGQLGRATSVGARGVRFARGLLFTYTQLNPERYLRMMGGRPGYPKSTDEGCGRKREQRRVC